jgi:DNA topoisomerase-3
LFSCDFPAEYKDWQSTDPFSLFSAPTNKTLENKSVMFNLQSRAKSSDILMLWLDNDKEGENICFEVMGVCWKEIRKMPQR